MTSGKDQTAHTKLKFRQFGQASHEEVNQRDLRSELEQRENKFVLEKDKTTAWLAKEEANIDVPLLLKNQPEMDSKKLQQYDDKDVEVDSDDDFDSSGGESDKDSDSDEDDDDDDDDDDEERELQAELERIRAERAVAQAKKIQDEKLIEEKMKRDSALKSNPLLSMEDSSAKLKRRWNDDVVFRNQAKDEPEKKKRFINDTIRSDFHRSFLKKFVK
jgi:protein CWC15